MEARSGKVGPYESLASIYDYAMRHVDYRHWASHVDDLLRAFGHRSKRLVELACGTGNVTFALADLGYDIRGYDGCDAMVRVARDKACADGRGLCFDVRDLRDLHGISPVEGVICLYDSINYLLELDHFAVTLEQVYGVLTPGGIFIFDVCTERNSLHYFDGVEDVDQGPGFRFTRRSDYHRGQRLQVNAFDIRFDDGRRLQETHVQHIYPIDLLRTRIEASPLALLAALDGFSRNPGSEHSDRVHFVLQRPPGVEGRPV